MRSKFEKQRQGDKSDGDQMTGIRGGEEERRVKEGEHKRAA